MSNHLLFQIVVSVVLDHGLGTVNFALHKSAVQSTTLDWIFHWTADKAVDGNSNGSDPGTSRACSATATTTSVVNHTWEVDIGFQIIVKTITVYRRTDKDFDQLSGFKLYIGNVSKPWIYNQEIPINSSNTTNYVFKPNNAIASVISLMKLGTILAICEVTVEGECLGGNFSEFCNLTCGTCYAYQPCNKENGTCLLGCDQGWKGTFCKEGCGSGNFGYNCNETCGHCLHGNNTCSATDGNCTNGCIAGWQGYQCNRGTVNFALRKPAVQSTTLEYIFNWTADKAVDGNSNGSDTFNSRTCSATAQTTAMVLHTWEVYIGFQIIVKNITVYGRSNTGLDQLSGFKLYIGNESESWTNNHEIQSSSSSNEKYVFTPNHPIASVISLTRLAKILVICEVTIEGECLDGNFSEFCNLTCGSCYAGQPCNKENGTCPLGCDQGWKGTLCKEGCERGNYGYNCNETCGHCLYGNNSCSTSDGNCTNGCIAGWQDNHCKRGTLETVTTVNVGPNTGVIVGSVLAAAGVSIFAMVIIIVIVKNRRKKHNNETCTDNVTTAAHYANVVVGNPVAVCKITARSITEKDTTFSAIEEPSLKRGMPIGATNSHSGVMGPDVPVQNVYEKLQAVTESTESAYYTIDHNRIDDQKMESIETCSSYVETLQSLESALKSLDEEISVLLDKKEQLLSKELETARANKLRDKWKKKDSDKDKDSTIVNFVQALQSIEGELRILEDKRKCLLGRKEILLRQELAKTTENEK